MGSGEFIEKFLKLFILFLNSVDSGDDFFIIFDI
jgi:hypothetical protein